VQDRLRIETEPPRAAAGVGRTDTIVISQVRLLRDCLEAALERDPSVRIVRGCETLAEAARAALGLRPCMMLLDGAFPEGPQAVTQLRFTLPAARVVAFALAETEQTILRWARAGIAGYVPASAPLSELSALLARITRGEQFCSSRVTGALLRRIGEAAGEPPDAPGRRASLTGRERDILRLVGLGLTNKEIARRLDIGLGTTKTHVHNLLSKLKLSSRAQVAAQLSVTHLDQAGPSAIEPALFTPERQPIYTPAAAISIPSPIPSD
jgi:DNA-binding NarL/FixJ family response regulator